jgi:L-asparaginase
VHPAPAREVTVLAAGGTIAMASGTGEAVVPSLDGAALVAAVPALAELSGLEVASVDTRPSVHLSGADALAIARAAVAAAERGRGVVVTHGTDTLEEVAFLCDLLYGGEAPVVFTGAMRPASAPGADGPANLLDAVWLAGSGGAAGLGVLVAFAGEVHAARGVRKADSTALRAFASPRLGPIGRVDEGRVTLWARLPRRPPLAVSAMDAAVDVVTAGLGSEERTVRAVLAGGAAGIVAVLLGAGHTAPAFLSALEAAAEEVPVVATVRPEHGAILHATYGFPGSERDLRAGALVCAGALSAAAARIKLMACLGAGLGREGIAEAFAPDDG